VADLARVEGDLDRLRVTGAVTADLLIGGVRDGAARVPDAGVDHPVERAEARLDAPEAARREGRYLLVLNALTHPMLLCRCADAGLDVRIRIRPRVGPQRFTPEQCRGPGVG